MKDLEKLVVQIQDPVKEFFFGIRCGFGYKHNIKPRIPSQATNLGIYAGSAVYALSLVSITYVIAVGVSSLARR